MSEFKINFLPEKYEDVIFPLMQTNGKFVLGGSLALYILNIMEYDFTNRTPDFDISLLESLTFNELEITKDFFGLEFKMSLGDYDLVKEEGEYKMKSTEYFLKKDLIQLCKTSMGEDGDLGYVRTEYIIDFFNSSLLPQKEVVMVNYKGYDLKLTHPSIILSYKSKYAYDNRVGKQYKHFEDLQKIDWKKYFYIIKNFVPKFETKIGDNGLGYSKILHYKYDPNEIDLLPY
jgi:hypothetical protein